VEYNIVINQATLRRWVGKVNLKDAAIIGFVRNLTTNDPLVRHYMLNGYFRLDAGWIMRQLPLLDISEDWLRRSLKKLEDLHLIDCVRVSGRKKRLTTYGRVSLTYLEEEQRVAAAIEEASDRYAEKTPGTGENSDTGRKLPVREKDPGESPIDHKIRSGKAGGTDPLAGSVASPSQDEEEQRRAGLLALREQKARGNPFAAAMLVTIARPGELDLLQDPDLGAKGG
jgi:hypothetical protein